MMLSLFNVSPELVLVVSIWVFSLNFFFFALLVRVWYSKKMIYGPRRYPMTTLFLASVIFLLPLYFRICQSHWSPLFFSPRPSSFFCPQKAVLELGTNYLNRSCVFPLLIIDTIVGRYSLNRTGPLLPLPMLNDVSASFQWDMRGW